MDKLCTPEVLKIVQDALLLEYGAELIIEIKEDGYSVTFPKNVDLEFKLPEIMRRLNELIYCEECNLFFQRDCLVYTMCTDIEDREVILRDVGHQMLSDRTLIEKAYMRFEDIKRGYFKVGSRKVRVKVLNEVRIVRNKEQRDIIEAEIGM